MNAGWVEVKSEQTVHFRSSLSACLVFCVSLSELTDALQALKSVQTSSHNVSDVKQLLALRLVSLRSFVVGSGGIAHRFVL